MTLFEELVQICRDGWAARAAARTASAAAIRAARSVSRSASPASSRAARMAASRSARSAALAASRAARKAAEAARGATVIRCFDFRDQEEERRHIRAGTPAPAPTPRIVPGPGVSVTDKDLETDEALWALYEQWCKALNKVRDHSDMVSRFNIYKDSAESVLSHNKAHEGMPEKHILLEKYADGYDAKDLEYIAKCKEAIVEAGCSHLLSSIDSSLPTPLVNSSP